MAQRGQQGGSASPEDDGEDSPKAQIPVSGVTRIEKLGGKAALILPTR